MGKTICKLNLNSILKIKKLINYIMFICKINNIKTSHNQKTITMKDFNM